MLRSPQNLSGLRTAGTLTLLLGLLAVAACLFTPAAEAKSTKRVTLGAKNLSFLKPNCGRDFSRDCAVEGKLTAFQSLSAKYKTRNFVVPWNGKLVSWSISLAQPTRKRIGDNLAQFPAFNLIFGAPAQAGISILREVQKRKKHGPRYKLVRKAPVEILNPYFGSRVTFVLDQPLNVFKDNIVALTIPTWAPALWKPKACNWMVEFADVLNPERCARATQRYTWRGSRVSRGEPATCELRNPPANEQLQKTAPQTRIDSIRRYGCYYGGNVLLYSATIVGR